MDVSKKPMGVYSVWLLGRSSGQFQKTLKVKCEKEKMPLTRDYAEHMNENWKSTGRWCEYHEAETVEYYKAGEEKYQANLEAEEIKSATTEVLKEAIKEVKKPRTRRKKATPKKDAEGGVNI